MATNRIITPHFRTISGMDGSTPPHLVDEGKWISSHGMRSYYGKVVQFPLLRSLGAINAAASEVTDVITLPLGIKNQCQISKVTIDGVYGDHGAAGTTTELISVETGSTLGLSSDPGDRQLPTRYATTVYAGQIWMTHPHQRLQSSDGSVVKQYGLSSVSGTITATLPTLSTNVQVTNIVTLQSLPGGIGSPQLGVSIRYTYMSNAPFVVGQRVRITAESSLSAFVKEYTVASVDFAGGLYYGVTLLCIPPETVPSIAHYTPSNMFVVSVGVPSVDATNIVATFTGTSDFRFLPGEQVRLAGFQNQVFNGVYSVVEMPAKNRFTVKLRSNPGVTQDPNTGTVTRSGMSDAPSARYIENFFDHIVMLNCTYRGVSEPFHLRWSDLYRPDVWDPTQENEADFYEISSWQRKSSMICGGTGMGKLGDVLFSYTDSCIVRTQYAGLPKVMVSEPAVEDFGNAFFDGLVVAKQAHFFYDAYHQNFFQYTGQGLPQAIGDAIVPFFLEKLGTSDPTITNLYTVCGFARQDRSEAWWTFYSGGDTAYYAIVYNWKAGEWTIFKTGSSQILGFSPGGAEYMQWFDDVATQINSVLTTFDTASSTAAYTPALVYGAQLFREEVAADIPGQLTLAEEPYLESRDYITDLQRVMELDRVTIHADYTSSAGVKVYVSARMSLQDPVVYKLVGTWTKNTRDGIITFQAMKGRVFRYKFVSGDLTSTGKSRGWVFYGFTDNVFNNLAEQ